MNRIAILHGMENTFPDALVERINSLRPDGVVAEQLKTGGVKMAEPSGYTRDHRPHFAGHPVLPRLPEKRRAQRHARHQQSLLVERRRQVFQLRAGVQDSVWPFRNTVLLPHKQHPPGTTDQSMRNLIYPLNWEEIFDYIGFPAFLKPHSGGGWKNVYKVDSPRRVFPRVRRDRRPVHDAADGRSSSTSISAAT